MPQVLRCRNSTHEKSIKKVGNILIVLEDNFIYARCTDRGCKRWVQIGVNVPGVELNFADVGFTQKLMPKGFKFKSIDGDIERAPVIIEE
jgi:hypothetical protein